jgi:hypothetical protein
LKPLLSVSPNSCYISKMITVRVATRGIERIDKFAKTLEPHLKNNKCKKHPDHHNILMLVNVIQGEFNYDVSDFCCDDFKREMAPILNGAKSYFI